MSGVPTTLGHFSFRSFRSVRNWRNFHDHESKHPRDNASHRVA
jgi:hypothetical protein